MAFLSATASVLQRARSMPKKCRAVVKAAFVRKAQAKARVLDLTTAITYTPDGVLINEAWTTFSYATHKVAERPGYDKVVLYRNRGFVCARPWATRPVVSVGDTRRQDMVLDKNRCAIVLEGK
jgi:hypothetical protein